MPVEIQNVMHVNVNCSDLGQSLAFYREIVGLVAQDHTQPIPQDGAGFGMAGSVQWDAHILQDARGYAGPAIDLLQWLVPEPCGDARRAPHQVGFNRLGVGVPDIDVVFRHAVSAGAVSADSPTPLSEGETGARGARSFECRDPDGTTIEFVEDDACEGPRLHHVNVNCSDLAQSLDWYQRVLGLEVRPASAPYVSRGLASERSDGKLRREGRFLWPREQDAFAIELVEWKTPAAAGRPPASANHRGLYRMAFMVADIREARDEILSRGAACPPAVYLDMGPEIPIDGLWALFFPDPDGTCMELIETPQLNA